MNQYTPTPGAYGNISAANFGQFNTQGYDTSSYGYGAAPSMSLAQAAWTSATTSNYVSPYKGMPNADYMQQVSERASMFWEQVAMRSAGAAAYGIGSLQLNAGSAFMTIGKGLGASKFMTSEVAAALNETGYSFAGDPINKGFYHKSLWDTTKSGSLTGKAKIGQALHKFGHSGEYGIAPQVFWHKGTRAMFNAYADAAAIPGEWAGSAVGNFLTSQEVRLGQDTGTYSKAAGNALSGLFNKMAGGNVESMAELMSGKGVKKGAATLFQRAAVFSEEKGAIAALTKGGLRAAGGIAGTMGYFLGTSAFLNLGISGVENVIGAGDIQTQEAALNFHNMKGKIFDSRGLNNANEHAKAIAGAIKDQVVSETGIDTAGERFFLGKKLGTGIERKSAMYSLFAQHGLTGKSSSADEFVQKAQALEVAVGKLAKMFGQTTTQAIDMVRVLKSQGISDSNLATAGANTKMTADMTGYTKEQVMSIQSHGTEDMRGTLFSSELGVGLANDVMRKTAVASQYDKGWGDTLFAMRGKDSANIFLTKTMGEVFKSKDVRRMFVSSLFEKDGDTYKYTGKVNRDAIQEAIAGGNNYITDSVLQNSFITRFDKNLTTEQRNAASAEIQTATSRVGSRGMMALLGNAYQSNGYRSTETGLIADLIKRGVPPVQAVSAAKAMTRNIDNDMMAQQYKSDALTHLNNKLAGTTSTSIMGAIGRNVDLGIVSPLLQMAGKASDAVFGKGGAAFGETFMAAGTGAMMAVGTAALPFAVPAAFGTMALANAYSNRNVMGSGLSKTLFNEVGGGDAINTAYGLGLNAVGAGGIYVGGKAIGTAIAAGGVSAAPGLLLGTGAGIGASYGAYQLGMNYGLDPASKFLTGSSIAQHQRTNSAVGLGLSTTMGAVLGGVGMFAGTALTIGTGGAALPLIAAATAYGGYSGATRYLGESDKLIKGDKRKRILGIAQSISDLRLLEGTGVLTEVERRHVAKNLATTTAKQHFIPDLSGEFLDASTDVDVAMGEADTYQDRQNVLTNFLTDKAELFMDKGPASSLRNRQRALKKRRDNPSIFRYIDRGLQETARGSNQSAHIQAIHEYAKANKSVIDLTKRDYVSQTMYALRELYDTSEPIVKKTILEQYATDHSDYFQEGRFSAKIKDSLGEEYSSFKAWAEGTAVKRITTIGEVDKGLELINKSLKWGPNDDNSTHEKAITIGESSAASYILNKFGTLKPGARKDVYNNTDAGKLDIAYMAKESGMAPTRIREILLASKAGIEGPTGPGNDTMRSRILNLADIGYLAKVDLTKSAIRGVVLGNVSHRNAHAAVSGLQKIVQDGRMTLDTAGDLYTALSDEVPNTFNRSVLNTIKYSKKLVGQAAQIGSEKDEDGNIPSLTYDAYQKKFGKNAMPNSYFARAAGLDKQLTAQELENFGTQGYISRRIPKILQDQAALAPVGHIESIERHTDKMAGYLERIAARFDPIATSPGGAITDSNGDTIIITKPKTTKEKD